MYIVRKTLCLVSVNCSGNIAFPYTENVLTECDLPQLQRLLIGIAYQAFTLGTQLGLTVGTVKAMQAESAQDMAKFLTLVLAKWLQRTDPPPTVQELCDILSDRVLDNESLACELRLAYRLS